MGKKHFKSGRFAVAIYSLVAFSGAFVAASSLVSPATAHFGCPTASSITGNSNDNILEGDGGGDASHDHQDYISGLDGADAIFGYTCVDELHGGAGRDHIHGANGGDILWGEDGDDYFDYCSATTGYCGELVGGDGNDYANGGVYTDYVEDTAPTDTDEIRGGAGNGDWAVTLDNDGSDTSAGDDGTDDICRRDGGDTQGTGCELP